MKREVAALVLVHVLLPLFFTLGIFVRELYEKNKEN
jgi:hypothetical protein